MFHKIATGLLTVYVLYSIIQTLRNGKLSFVISIWKRFTLRMFGENLLWILSIMIALGLLIDLPVLRWGWMKLLTGSDNNIIFSPFGLTGQLSVVINTLLTTAFMIIVIVALPLFAHWEEKTFRFKQLNRRNIIISSVIFGLLHPLLAGIPIGAGIALIGSGFILSFYYRRAYFQAIGHDEKPEDAHNEALLTSTAYHTMFNTTIVLVVILEMVLPYFSK